MGFAILLVRRIGLAVGMWMAVFYGMSLFWGSTRPVIGMACGMATMAFFLPRPGIGAGAKACCGDKDKAK